MALIFSFHAVCTYWLSIILMWTFLKLFFYNGIIIIIFIIYRISYMRIWCCYATQFYMNRLEWSLFRKMHIHAFTGSLLQDHKIRERGDGWKFLSSSSSEFHEVKERRRFSIMAQYQTLWINSSLEASSRDSKERRKVHRFICESFFLGFVQNNFGNF